MNEKNGGELLFLLKASYGWLISAMVLVTFFSFVICKTSLDSSYMGYVSSFISFTAAVVAGYCSSKSRRGAHQMGNLISALFLVIILLTFGFTVEGKEMEPAGIISVASFSFAGVMLGGNLKSLFAKRHFRSTSGFKRNDRR